LQGSKTPIVGSWL